MNVMVIMTEHLWQDEAAALLKKGETCGECVQLAKNFYAIRTLDPPSTVLDNLKDALGKDRSIFVLPVKETYAGQVPSEIKSWLRPKLITAEAD